MQAVLLPAVSGEHYSSSSMIEKIEILIKKECYSLSLFDSLNFLQDKKFGVIVDSFLHYIAAIINKVAHEFHCTQYSA